MMHSKYFVKFEHDDKLMIAGFLDEGSADRFAQAKSGELLAVGKKDFKLLKSYK